MIDFQTDPSRYRHWKLSFEGQVATLTMDVDPNELSQTGWAVVFTPDFDLFLARSFPPAGRS